MTLEELVVSVQRPRQRMAPLSHEWAGAIDDAATRQLVGSLAGLDRELGHLCRQLSWHIGRIDLQQTNEQEGHNNGRQDRSDPRGQRS